MNSDFYFHNKCSKELRLSVIKNLKNIYFKKNVLIYLKVVKFLDTLITVNFEITSFSSVSDV